MNRNKGKIFQLISAQLTGKSGAPNWLVILLFFTFIGIMNFNRFYTNELAEGEAPNFYHYFINEMTGAYAVMALLPLLFFFFKKFPLLRDNWRTRLPLYLLATVAFGFCHTMLMFLSRKAIYKLALQKDYDYGHLGLRFLMEYNHQFFTFWIIYGIVFLVGMMREHQRQKLKAVELEQQLTKARLQALQMQLNPHFLFNTLNMISATMYEDVEAADKMLANLSDMLRLSLNRENRDEHALAKELELLHYYLDIMKARFADKLSIKLDIAAETKDALVPAFILQPLVENSIRHSLETLHVVEIEIISRRINDDMILSVKDNGPGIVEDVEEILKNGIGLSNTAERLEKLYGNAHRFHWENIAGGGLQIVATFPLRLATEFLQEARANGWHENPDR